LRIDPTPRERSTIPPQLVRSNTPPGPWLGLALGQAACRPPPEPNRRSSRLRPVLGGAAVVQLMGKKLAVLSRKRSETRYRDVPALLSLFPRSSRHRRRGKAFQTTPPFVGLRSRVPSPWAPYPAVAPPLRLTTPFPPFASLHSAPLALYLSVAPRDLRKGSLSMCIRPTRRSRLEHPYTAHTRVLSDMPSPSCAK
jgi:hypothetical protein